MYVWAMISVSVNRRRYLDDMTETFEEWIDERNKSEKNKERKKKEKREENKDEPGGSGGSEQAPKSSWEGT